jgi:hypothetical protein
VAIVSWKHGNNVATRQCKAPQDPWSWSTGETQQHYCQSKSFWSASSLSDLNILDLGYFAAIHALQRRQ